MNRIRCLALLLLTALLAACVDEIDLEQGANLPSGIVLQGRLNVDDGAGELQVRLERLFRFENSNRPDQVVTAAMVLENTEGQSLPVPYIDGSYQLSIPANDPTFTIRTGVGYRLTVQTREGENYISDYDVLQPELSIEEVMAVRRTILQPSPSIDEDVEVDVFSYSVSGPARYPDGAPARFRYTLERTFALTDAPTYFPYNGNLPKRCYITESVAGNRVIVLNGNDLGVDRLVDFPLVDLRNDYHFTEGNYLTVLQENLSREAFQYFDQIADVADNDASIFAPPPGPVVGNVRDVDGISSNVFGFFYVASRSRARVGVSPDEADKIFAEDRRCPLAPSMNPFPPATGCDECLLFEGSTTEVPEFWEF